MTSTIGFVGLGTMGLPMARSLVANGHPVLGVDPAPTAVDAARDAGIEVLPELSTLGGRCREVVTMLPSGAHLADVVLGSGGLADTLPSGSLVIDSSTVEIHTTTTVAAALAERGIDFVDAPVSGGVGAARAGSLTFMVGGDAGVVDRARGLLDAMGSTVIHAGPAGSGQAAKTCNNLMFGISLVGAAEAFVLADRLGLAPTVLYDIVSRSSGNSWAVQNFCPWPGTVPGSAADDGYAPRFAAKLMLKDLGLALTAAEVADVDLAVLRTARALFERAVQDDGDLDASVVVRQVGAPSVEGRR